MGRLMLSLKERGETVVVQLGNGEEVCVQVNRFKGSRVELAVEAPPRCKVLRQNRNTPSPEGDNAT